MLYNNHVHVLENLMSWARNGIISLKIKKVQTKTQDYKYMTVEYRNEFNEIKIIIA
jgi:hypothetical protein